MSEQRFDVVIVGGGVIGSSIACFLGLDPDFDGSVAVVERDPSYQGCSTALSAGGIRHQFSTETNIRISQFGSAFLHNIGDYLAVDGEVPVVDFVENGYLFLASDAGRDVLERNHRLQTGLGAEIALLEPVELAERFPWLHVDDLAGGGFGLRGEGWLDPYSLLRAFRRKARALGVTYIDGEVTSLQREGARITAVTLADGGRIICGALVNAAGPRAAAVAAMADVPELPVRPRKRCVFVFQADGPPGHCPLTVDPSGVYFRPEGDRYICGVGPEEDPDCDDYIVDHELFEEVIWPTLAHRVPAFEALRPGPAWAGHYAVNTADHNAVLGPHPEVGNFYFANGFSGHGLQQSPAVGRYISELITHGAPRTLDLGEFAFERLAEGRLVRELNVV
ncbi:NAD(P)/FAD-dependent oxidoreductase [Arhodomonas sp. SL1]|uniref:NAD(P)/FAD-dependent oxidoreductase n=1 Tax=Arhodomonas sp. SL1 TaxID=3425691 RepID=UPI003F88528E